MEIGSTLRANGEVLKTARSALTVYNKYCTHGVDGMVKRKREDNILISLSYVYAHAFSVHENILTYARTPYDLLWIYLSGPTELGDLQVPKYDDYVRDYLYKPQVFEEKFPIAKRLEDPTYQARLLGRAKQWVVHFPGYISQVHTNYVNTMADLAKPSYKRNVVNVERIVEYLKDAFTFLEETQYIRNAFTRDPHHERAFAILNNPKMMGTVFKRPSAFAYQELNDSSHPMDAVETPFKYNEVLETIDAENRISSHSFFFGD